MYCDKKTRNSYVPKQHKEYERLNTNTKVPHCKEEKKSKRLKMSQFTRLMITTDLHLLFYFLSKKLIMPYFLLVRIVL